MSTRTIYVCDACLRESPPATDGVWPMPPVTWSTITVAALEEDKRHKHELLACSSKCTATILRQLLKRFDAPTEAS
jgi:hypothetical protein